MIQRDLTWCRDISFQIAPYGHWNNDTELKCFCLFFVKIAFLSAFLPFLYLTTTFILSLRNLMTIANVSPHYLITTFCLSLQNLITTASVTTLPHYRFLSLFTSLSPFSFHLLWSLSFLPCNHHFGSVCLCAKPE